MWQLLPLLVTTTAAAAEPQLPKLASTAPIVHPTEERHRRATVVLELIVDQHGIVVDATIAESAGLAFDHAALAAIRAFRFVPGTDESGQPMSATIQYAMVFDPDKAQTLRVEGLVHDGATETPLPDVPILATGPDGSRASGLTDDSGAFALAGLPPGRWTLEVAHSTLRSIPAEVEVLDGKILLVTLFARHPEEVSEVSEVIEVIGYRDIPLIGERTLGDDELRFVPGSAGDIVRAVQNLPGIGRPPFNLGLLLVRGTGPDDSAFTLDGVEIPLVFHFGGLTTVLSSSLLEEVAYLPGSQSARYGRITGGVIDLRAVSEPPPDLGGAVSIDLFQTALEVESPLSSTTGFRLSGRRSYIDAVLNPISNRTEDTLRAPRYYDGQLQILHAGPRGLELDLLLLAADDRFQVLDPDPDEPPSVDVVATFQKARLAIRAETGKGVETETALLGGPDNQRIQLGDDGEVREEALTLHLRHEWSNPITDEDRWGWLVGGELLGGRRRFEMSLDLLASDETTDSVSWEPALYVEPSSRIGPWTVTPGVRGDLMMTDAGYLGAVIDPRLGNHLQLSPVVELEVATGRYSMLPQARQLEPPLGRSDLQAEHSWQNQLAVLTSPGRGWEIRSGVFYNLLDQLVVGRSDVFSFSDPNLLGPTDDTPLSNDGKGRTYGIEALVRWRHHLTFAWLSATLSRSERRHGTDTDWLTYRYDQPVNLIALGSHELPRRWRVGSRARFGIGSPYTPAVQRVYFLDERKWHAIWGEENSVRLPPTWQLDLRVDKEWQLRGWTLAAYLDVSNITNARNVDLMAWTTDYKEEEPIYGLPILPAFGVKGTW